MWPFKRHTERLIVKDKSNDHLRRLAEHMCAQQYTHHDANVMRAHTQHDFDVNTMDNTVSLHSSRSSVASVDDFITLYNMQHYEQMVRLLHDSAKAQITTNNNVTVLTDGNNTFNAILRAMETANCSIHFQMYIFHADSTGQRVIDLMMRKARQGVKVRVIVDAIGGLSSRAKKTMRNAGIHVATWFPLRGKNLRMSRLQHRNHRKIVIVDGAIGFMGGINWSDMYDESLLPEIGWRDTFVQIVGDAVQYLQAIFVDDFEYAMGERLTKADLHIPPPFTETENNIMRDLTNDNVTRVPMQVVASGPDSIWRFAHQLFFMALSLARTSLLISTPYLAMDDSLKMAIKTTALSGVDVHLVTQGKMERRNFMTYLCGRAHLDELLKYGVHVYQYMPGIYHTKAIIVDHKWAIVTSANMDYRSYDCCFEVSSVIYDSRVCNRLERDFWHDVDRSRKVTTAQRDRTNSVVKFAEYLCKQLAPHIKL